jgi:hypothetical protein
MLKSLDTRDVIALGITLAFVLGCFFLLPDRLAPLTNVSMLVIGYYFGNKSTMDKMESK